MNGDFEYWQRGTSVDNAYANFEYSINYDTYYTADRWKLISDGNNIVDVGRELTETPTTTWNKEPTSYVIVTGKHAK